MTKVKKIINWKITEVKWTQKVSLARLVKNHATGNNTKQLKCNQRQWTGLKVQSGQAATRMEYLRRLHFAEANREKLLGSSLD